MFIAAMIGVAASTLVPLVIEEIVNGPIKNGERGELVPLFLAVLGLGIAEAGLIAYRRYIQSIAVLTIEREMRDDLYAHLQRLSVSFHDRWGTGQLLSRATSDLSTIRRFFGFGAIYLVVNTVQYIAVLVLLIATYWPLGILVAASTIPVIILSRRFGGSYAVVSRRMQDQQGDLATRRRGSRERDPGDQGVRPRAVAHQRLPRVRRSWFAARSSTWSGCSAGSGRC